MLMDGAGKLETGVVEGSVTVVTSKNGGALTGFTLTGLWAELGQGLYTINFASGDLDTEGFFIYLVTVEGCDQYSGIMYVSDWETNVDSILEHTATTMPAALTTHDTEVKAAITATEGNIRGVDSDTLKTLSEQIDECQNELDTLPPDPADESLLEAAITAAQTSIETAVTTAEGNVRGADSDDLKALSDQLDTAQTELDTLPDDPADQSLIEAAITATQTAITTAITTAEGNVRGTDDDDLKVLSGQLDDASTALGVHDTDIKADIATAQAQIDTNGVDINTGLANQTVMNGKLDTNATAIAGCQTDLDNPDQYKADVTALALEASLDDVDIDLTTLKEAVAYIKQKESGRWKIENNQLTYYDTDGTTVLKRFNLFNKEGQAADENPYERVPV